jgi:hypothetical protein
MSQATDTAQFDRCEQCSAPVDRDQRYCVNCGTHRRHVPDPAAKYMSRVSAHTGPRAGGVAGAVAGGAVVKGAPGGGLSRLWTSGVGLLGALAIALIPVAAAIGVIVGHSSSGSNSKLDSKLIAALESQQGGTTQTVVSTTAGSASSSSSSTSTKTAAKKTGKQKVKTKTAASTGTSKTSNGTATKVAGEKVTSKQQAQGSQEAQKIQKSTGKSYVQGSSNLPSQVVVGP